MLRTIHIYVVANQLAIVLVGREHVSLDACLTGAQRQCANHVVGFKPIGL